MKRFIRYFYMIMIFVFCIIYMNKVFELSKKNDVIMDAINLYKDDFDYKCAEGSINDSNIIIGNSGKSVNVIKSYGNMKGIGFRKDLITYDIDECVTSASNNLDKYIIGAFNTLNKVSIVIKINDGKYINEMVDVFDKNNAFVNMLANYNNVKYIDGRSNIVFSGNSEREYKNFKNTLKSYNIDKYYCSKSDKFDVLSVCARDNISTLYVSEVVNRNLVSYIKNNVGPGNIIFISENEYILSELSVAIKYIKSKGFDIVSLDELLK